MQPSEWVPIRWPADAAWHAPEALSILKGSPINCLVISAEQKKVEALVNGATARALALVEDGRLPDSILAPADTVWPGVKLASRADAEAGPTGPPWIDSNGWRCLLGRAQHPRKSVWIFADAPEDGRFFRAQAYTVAIADAAAHGGRWVVSLDAQLRKGLLERQASALQTWSGIGEALRFFEKHRGRRDLPTTAQFGVLSDFSGPNEFLSHEILNLAPRRYLSCRVLDVSKTSASSFDGLKGVIWVDEKPPAGEMHRLLMKFAEGGGLLILPYAAAELVANLKGGKKHKTGYTVSPTGRGRIAVAPEPWADPYVTVSDAHLLLSRQHDVYRVFNSGATNVHCTSGPSGATVLHVINYTGRTSYNPMSVYVAKRHTEARWYTPAGPDGEKLPVNPAAEGVEVHLPAFAAYAGIEFGGLS